MQKIEEKNYLFEFQIFLDIPDLGIITGGYYNVINILKPEDFSLKI